MANTLAQAAGAVLILVPKRENGRVVAKPGLLPIKQPKPAKKK